MDLVEYAFGTGIGEPHTWTSDADLDLGEPGGVDAVALDFDGDGWLDDALWDSDGDGRADHSVLDVGSAHERYFTDPGGRGTWAAESTPPAATTGRAPVSASADTGFDGDGDNRFEAILSSAEVGTVLLVDTDGDAVMDLRLVDSDGDGRLDGAAASVDGG